MKFRGLIYKRQDRRNNVNDRHSRIKTKWRQVNR